MTYISVNDVRLASGVPSSLLSDSQIESVIPTVERLTEKWLNARFRPTLAIENHDGNGTDRFNVLQNPLLSVRRLKIEDTSISIENLKIYKGSGRIMLGSGSEQAIFINKPKSVKVQYLYGWVEPQRDTSDDFIRTEMSADASAGTSVDLYVNDVKNFAAGQFVEIKGMDGNDEVAKITSVDGVASTITVDYIALDHEELSFVTRVAIPYYIKRFMEVEAAIYVAINALGGTYTFNASYQIGELAVTKGVPYTHWRESYDKNYKERESLKQLIKKRNFIVAM